MGDENEHLQYKGEVKREIIFGDYIRDGLGSSNHPNGSKYIGGWKDGKLWNGTFYNKDGIIKVKYINGEMILQ